LINSPPISCPPLVAPALALAPAIALAPALAVASDLALYLMKYTSGLLGAVGATVGKVISATSSGFLTST